MALMILVLLTIVVSGSLAEEYNLSGFPGQGYKLDIELGHPTQKLSVLLDTGSGTLAVASRPEKEITTYFEARNSSTVRNLEENVQSHYTVGQWTAHLVSDFVKIPSLSSAPEVRSDIALITNADDFFMNGSGWQGILGIAYPITAASAPHMASVPWFHAVDKAVGTPISFDLKLCGVESPNDAMHRGRFRLLDDSTTNENNNKTYRTPILRKVLYEVGFISIHVIKDQRQEFFKNHRQNIVPDHRDVEVSLSQSRILNESFVNDSMVNKSVCAMLNVQGCIVDSGTTNVRVPEVVFKQIVKELKVAAEASNILILDEYWYHGETACWPQPREWSLPWLGIDLLNYDDYTQYFTLHIPPQNYMHLMTARNSAASNGIVSEYCYKFGLEIGNATVLGITALEGLQITFNKSSNYIGFQTSNCGSDVRISGPYNTTVNLHEFCSMQKPLIDLGKISIDTATCIAAIGLTIVLIIIIFTLLRPTIECCKRKLKRRSSDSHSSIAALVIDFDET